MDNGKFCFDHPSGKGIYLYTLRNANGSEVIISNYGAIVLSYRIKTDEGFNDIVLGFESVADYLKADYLQTYPYMGAAIGRYANRIKDSAFEIDGNRYTLSRNWGSDQLHGGLEGFDKKVWDFVSFDEKCNILQLAYRSADGEEGFPGNLDVNICFELNDDDDLIYEYSATTDQPTAVNLAHHGYFNLNNGEGTIQDHELKVYAEKVLAQDSNLSATGAYVDVADTRFDFTDFKRIGDQLEGGYDQSFEVEKDSGQLSMVAELVSKTSGLKLQVLSTEPVLHVYTAQGLPHLKGKYGHQYGAFSAVCLETQKHPNAVNVPSFPNTILRPGEKYFQRNVYKVSRR